MNFILCILFLILTASNTYAMGSSPPAPDEKDPIFKEHPANQINSEDVTTLKNISFTPEGELSDIPILPGPPDNITVEGTKYINVYSSEMCVYRCERIGGVKGFCGWTSRDAFSRFTDPLCQAPTSTPPLLDFNSISHSAGIINFTDLTEIAPFSMMIEYEIRDSLFSLNMSPMEFKGIAITKISNDITQEDSAIDSGEWNLNNRYKRISYLPLGSYPTIKQITFHAYSVNNELVFKIDNQNAGSWMEQTSPLETGIYGIVVNNIDITNNQRKALWLPVKFLYIQ